MSDVELALWAKCILVFLFAASNNWIQDIAAAHREENHPIRGALYLSALGLMAWLSMMWVLLDSRYLVIPDVIGVGIGSFLEIKYANNNLDVQKIRATPAGLIVSLVCSIQRRNVETKKGTPQ